MNTKMCPVGKHSSLFSLIVLPILLVNLLSGCGPGNPVTRPSPLVQDSIRIGSTDITILYSSPRVRKREIWGDLVAYDRIWRTGANEATILTVSKSIRFNNTPLPAGKYSIFTIPGKNHWTIILNEEWAQWGAYNYDSLRDVVRVDVHPQKLETASEEMKFILSSEALTFQWETLTFDIPIEEN